MRPLLVAARLVAHDAYPETRDALDVRWGSFLASAGLMPIVVPARASLDPYFELENIAGLLITGGNDLAAVNDNPLSRERDARERQLLRKADEQSLPVLGVCRGLQLIAWMHGLSPVPVEGHVASEHALSVSSSSRFLRAHDGLVVNSYHATGISGSAPELIIVATAEDGSVEALEHDSRQVLGIMWHPERNPDPAPQDVALFRSFFGVEVEQT